MSREHQISAFIQHELIRRGLQLVSAVDAAKWLDRAGLLRDSLTRPGKPLRDLLRDRRINGQRQDPNTRWFIDRVEPAAGNAVQENQPESSTPAVASTALAVEKSTEAKRGKARVHSDEAYVIDLCDEVLGQRALRQHRFDWLLGDLGVRGTRTALPVDGYYPMRSVVIEYRELQHIRATPFFDRRHTVSGVGRGQQRRLYDQRREIEIPLHGLKLIVIEGGQLDADSRGRLRRNRASDLVKIRQLLET